MSRRTSGLRGRRGSPVGTCSGSSVRDQSAKRSLHHPVLERVVREHEHAALGREQVHRLVEPGREVRQLAVHLHADRLERAARRVAAAPAGGRRDRRLDRLDELAGRRAAGGRRRSRPRSGARSAPRRCAAMSAARSASAYSLTTSAAVSACALSMRMSSGASAQYEKPALGSIELRAAHAQVEQDSHDVPSLSGVAPHDVGDVARSRRARCGPIPEGSERRARRRHGGGVPVDAEETEVGSGVEDAPAWPPPPTVASTTSPAGPGSGAPPPPGHHRAVLERASATLQPSRLPLRPRLPGTATSPPDASTKAKRAEGALAPRRPGGWWRARGSPLSMCAVSGVRSRSPAGRRTRSGLAPPPGRARATGRGPRSRSGRTRPTTITSRLEPGVLAEVLRAARPDPACRAGSRWRRRRRPGPH